MPRSGWLAVGTVAAAALAPIVGWSTAVAAVALIGAGLMLAAARGRVPAVRQGTVVILGAAALLARVALGGADPVEIVGPPDGRGPWQFEVVAVGSDREGQQTATLRSIASGADVGFVVAATLPAYPDVSIGDVVTAEGPIRPRPDSPYRPVPRAHRGCRDVQLEGDDRRAPTAGPAARARGPAPGCGDRSVGRPAGT